MNAVEFGIKICKNRNIETFEQFSVTAADVENLLTNQNREFNTAVVDKYI